MQNILKKQKTMFQTSIHSTASLVLENMENKYQAGYSSLNVSSNGPSHLPDATNNRPTRLSVSPVLPGTGNVTYNITRMLRSNIQTLRNDSTDQRTQEGHMLPYSTSHFMSFRHNALREFATSCDTG